MTKDARSGQARASSSEPGVSGLCKNCRHAHRVASNKGSVFLLCGLSKTNRAFPKYPRLPVVSCQGYETTLKNP